MRTGVTTIRHADSSIIKEAKRRGEALGFPYIPRGDTLEEMTEETGLSGFLIYGKQLPLYWSDGEEYRFHMGTAVLRTTQLRKGNPDRLCALLPADGPCDVLDCTFGQAGDSSTMSWFLTGRGRVTALEKSPILYEVGRAGIAGYEDKDESLTDAVRRIHLIHADYREYLAGCQDGAYDVIYFDPMFRHPVKRRENDMEGFRAAAVYDSLTVEILREALRVCRRKVIVKERPFAGIFSDPIFTDVRMKRGQSTAYGVIEKR